jgi:sugar phosphate isomerase/epimerase
MFKNLNAGAIGIRNLSLPDIINLARQSGFQGIDFNIREAANLADTHGVAYVRNLFGEAGIQPALWGLPIAWNRDTWQQDLEELPRLAALAVELGSFRTATWCPPSSAERPYPENFEWHATRFRAIAEVLKAHNISFGIEFIGPKTMRPPEQHDFIYTLAGLLELIEAIGTGNVGLLLDAYHLFTSGGSWADMDKLTAADIVTVHVNDAPTGLTLETYLDQDRRLPMETGVIDLPGFMQKLAQLGYAGPVTPEPFSQRVNAIEEPLAAARLTASYMDKLWQASGLE